MTHTFNCHSDRVLKNCIEMIKQDGLGKEVKIGPIRKSRSQEAFFHACLQVIANDCGESVETLKLRLKYTLLPLEEIITTDGKKYLHPVSTVNLPKETYTRLIDAALMLGATLGLRMPDPQFYGYKLNEEK